MVRWYQSSSWGIFRAWSQRSAEHRTWKGIKTQPLQLYYVLGSWKKRSWNCTCPFAAEFVFDVICLVSEEFNDFIFMLLNNRFTLGKKKVIRHHTGTGFEYGVRVTKCDRTACTQMLIMYASLVKLNMKLTANFKLAVALESNAASERSMASPLRDFILM